MNILLKIKQSYPLLNERNQRIADIFLSNPEAINMTISEAGRKSQTSAATVMRFVRKFNFEGYNSFRLELAREKGNSSEIDLIVNKDDSIEGIKQKVESLLETTARDTSTILGEREVEAAVSAIQSSKCVYTIGVGASSGVAYDMAHKLNRAGHLAIHNWDIHLTIENLHYISERDVLLAFSYSGKTREVRLACKIAKERHAKVFIVTSSQDEALVDISDALLLQPKTEHLLRISSISSAASAMQIATILFLGVLEVESDENIISKIQKTSELIQELEK